MKKLLFILLTLILSILPSCSKYGDIGGTKIYYVIERYYNTDIPEWLPPREGNPNVLVSMTMPEGNKSEGLITVPHTTFEREYKSGMLLTIRAESVLSYTTITVKIFRDGKLWKENTATSTQYGVYAVAEVSGDI